VLLQFHAATKTAEVLSRQRGWVGGVRWGDGGEVGEEEEEEEEEEETK
jgi:hypothetical protein